MIWVINLFNYSIKIVVIVILANNLIIGANLVSISFKSANAQNNDFNLERIQHMMMGRGPHMMGPGPHHNMIENRMHQQMQPNSPNNFSMIKGNNATTIDNKNLVYVSIVFGATSRTTNAYQPNPVYIKEGLAAASTINNNNNNRTSSSPSPSSSMSMLQRGNIAMGFDQNKIRHNFTSTSTGGEIIITSLNGNDNTTINHIREHIKDIQNDFSNGNFTKPFFIHAQDVPGTKVMREKSNLINYSINELPNGSSLTLKTTDEEVLNAIHQFLTFQSTQHKDH